MTWGEGGAGGALLNEPLTSYYDSALRFSGPYNQCMRGDYYIIKTSTPKTILPIYVYPSFRRQNQCFKKITDSSWAAWNAHILQNVIATLRADEAYPFRSKVDDIFGKHNFPRVYRWVDSQRYQFQRAELSMARQKAFSVNDNEQMSMVGVDTWVECGGPTASRRASHARRGPRRSGAYCVSGARGYSLSGAAPRKEGGGVLCGAHNKQHNSTTISTVDAEGSSPEDDSGYEGVVGKGKWKRKGREKGRRRRTRAGRDGKAVYGYGDEASSEDDASRNIGESVARPRRRTPEDCSDSTNWDFDQSDSDQSSSSSSSMTDGEFEAAQAQMPPGWIPPGSMNDFFPDNQERSLAEEARGRGHRRRGRQQQQQQKKRPKFDPRRMDEIVANADARMIRTIKKCFDELGARLEALSRCSSGSTRENNNDSSSPTPGLGSGSGGHRGDYPVQKAQSNLELLEEAWEMKVNGSKLVTNEYLRGLIEKIIKESSA